MTISSGVRLWLHGLAAAFITGTTTSFSTMLVDGDKFNVNSLSGLKHLATVALVSGVLAAVAYLKQSPIPSFEQQASQQTVQTPDGTVTKTTNITTTTTNLALLALLLPVLALAGCAKATSATPATAPDPYTVAAQQMLNFATDVQQAQQIEISVYNGGAIDKATHVAIQQGFKQVATYGPQITSLIQGQAGATTIQAKVNEALAAVQGIVVTTGKLDQNAAKQLQVTIQTIQLLLQAVSTTFNVKTSEVTFGHDATRTPGRAALAARHFRLPAVEASARTAGYHPAFVG